MSSKYTFASQSLNCSLYIFFLLGILLRNSVVAALEVVSLLHTIFPRFDYVLRNPKSILIYYHNYITKILFDLAYSVFQVF